MDAALSSALALCTILSGPLLTLSIACLNVGILLNRRVSLYIPTETLVLLCLVYAFRYRVVFDTLFSLNHLGYKLDMFALLMATLNVHIVQQSTSLRATTSRVQETACDETQIETMTAVLAQPSFTKMKHEHIIGFNVVLFRRTVVWTLIPALYIGDRSLLSRGMSRWYGNSIAPFWADAFIQLHFVVAMLELSAVQLLLSRMLALRRAQVHLLPPPEATLTAHGITQEVWSSRLRSPTAIWAFAWCTQLGAALSLPALIAGVVRQAKRSGELDDILLYKATGAGMQVVCFAAFLLFYRYCGRGKIQLPRDEEK
ncbi:hypothetical protein PSEUBRA_006128 [Kalmanozyma brasiliensis GHG001]|uniref:uncharacterized protein n=1 Tax=Kalmanozyma brasiliensis (strain GHG001) TaxID=1365824 RepID=UPI001CE8B823|nr:uncharacterized protein PSEUBRA_006128 [Kalmanozyma brasiliensis GHG001]KAF6767621.1 hypothetical protein PSEUBRA_006128 [Kalmanozyma brasiliensis GHG001]